MPFDRGSSANTGPGVARLPRGKQRQGTARHCSARGRQRDSTIFPAVPIGADLVFYMGILLVILLTIHWKVPHA